MRVRRVPRYAAFALVIATGLLVGMAMRSALTPPVNRGDQFVAIFEQWCVARLNGLTPQQEGVLHPVKMTLDMTVWIETRTGLVLEPTAGGCTVNDAPHHLDTEARAVVTAQVVDRMHKWAPALQQGQPRLALELAAFFFSDSTDHFSDPSRWGVFLSRAQKTGEDAQTSLTLSLPKQVSE